MTKFINDLPNLESTFLRAQFRYEPETGLLTWIAKRQGVRTGTFAGRQRHAADSAHVALHKHQYPVELIVWAIHRGTWPSHVPYHLDRNRLNNRIENLALPVGANQVKPLRKRSMAALQARIDDQYNIAHDVRPAPRMTATEIAVALAPRKRNNRGRKAAAVAVTLTETSEVPKTALEAMRILLQDTEAHLEEQRSIPPDMHPAEDNIAGRAAVIEYTRKLASVEGRILEMRRKIAMMEEQDAANGANAANAAVEQPPLKGADVLRGLFAKVLHNTPHRITPNT